MTFCTACASAVGPKAAHCPSCGAALPIAGGESRERPSPTRGHSRAAVMRLLYLAPAIVIGILIAAGVQRHFAEEAWLASTYAAAERAQNAGELVAARDGFRTIVGFRDAEARLAAVDAQLQPFEARYSDGVQAMERGDYAAAVELLQPVAAQAPDLGDVETRLDDSRRLLNADLQRQVDGAEATHDWPLAEQLLRQVVLLDPADGAARARLATNQRLHGPLVLGHDRDLWLVAPDGSESRQLTDSLQTIWPVWSPDRTHVAFLASDADDPMGNVALYVIGLDDDAPVRLATGVSAHAPPAWSPDGSLIAYTSFAGYDPVYESGSIGVRIADVATRQETDLTGAEYSLAFNPTWSPDGKQIAFVVKYQGMDQRPQHSPGDVLMATLGEEGFENLTNGSVSEVWSAAWSPTGHSLLLFSLFGQTWYEPPSTSIAVLSRDTGEIVPVARVAEHPSTPVWAPDGSRFAFTADETSILISDSLGNREDAVEVQTPLSGDLSWSPDGQALLATPWEAGAASTILNFAAAEPKISAVQFDFDANPPFIAPPQWAPAVAIPPADNSVVPDVNAIGTPVA